MTLARSIIVVQVCWIYSRTDIKRSRWHCFPLNTRTHDSCGRVSSFSSFLEAVHRSSSPWTNLMYKQDLYTWDKNGRSGSSRTDPYPSLKLGIFWLGVTWRAWASSDHSASAKATPSDTLVSGLEVFKLYAGGRLFSLCHYQFHLMNLIILQLNSLSHYFVPHGPFCACVVEIEIQR